MKRIAISIVVVVALGGFSLFLVWAVPRGCDAQVGNVPMVVYGMVVDQAGAPVPDATLEFCALRSTRSPFASPMGEDNVVEWRAWATTGPSGTFCLRAGNGHTMAVQSITKDGYRWQPSGPSFRFMNAGSGAMLYKPDPANPVKFIMWNLGAAKIVTRTVTCRVKPGDRGSRLNYLDGTFEQTNGPGQIAIAVDQPKAGDISPDGCEIVLGDGSGPQVVEAKDALGPEAPKSGYVKSITFKVGRSDPGWPEHIVRRFYTHDRFEDIYAGVELEARLSPDGGPITVTVHYTADFGKSRDLVPGPVAATRK